VKPPIFFLMSLFLFVCSFAFFPELTDVKTEEPSPLRSRRGTLHCLLDCCFLLLLRQPAAAAAAAAATFTAAAAAAADCCSQFSSEAVTA
jgi:hypothetical protein